MTDWNDPKWSNPLVHIAADGSFVADAHSVTEAVDS